MDKNIVSNLVALLIFVVGFLLQNSLLQTVGLFALSGALTNWLAIHMLFEKVPFLYGSGVIQNKFEVFKASIHSMIMEQFFTKENLQKFFEAEFNKEDTHFNFENLINNTDFSIAFNSLKDAVMGSSFGGMLSMFGGEKALDPLKESFESKMKKAINEIVHTDTFQQSLKSTIQKSDISEDLVVKIDFVVRARLEELTPSMVKELVQKVIREHLGWLVVWGAVFGGLIGLVSSLIL
ncbi:MAG: DUF445 domain-containing protein [Campylobacterales bacterium]|nr:DUF445 domain-containing protein [Campylobacterales bacterium]